MATMLQEQEATLPAKNLMERPLKKIRHVQQVNLCLLRSKGCLYAEITLPANFAGVHNVSDLTIEFLRIITKCEDGPTFN